jgi:hypothetical protein
MAVPGRTSRANATGSTTSRVMTSGSPVASSSRVALTEPSTEFSNGTIAASASPSRTASRVAGTVGYGSSSARAAAGSERSAASVKVPCGPR